MEKKKNDTPLTCRVEGSEIVIRIGTDRIVFCAKFENGGSIGPATKIVNKRKFVKDFIRALEREDEIGSTILNRAFDAAIEELVDDGSESLKCGDDQAAREGRRG